MDKSLIEIIRKNKIENLLGFISRRKNILTSYIEGKRFVIVGDKKNYMPTYQHASRAGLEILYLLELLILQEYPLENFRRIYLEYNNLQKQAYEKSKLE